MKTLLSTVAHRPVTWGAIGLFAVSPLWSGRLQPHDYEGGRSRNEEARAYRNASSVAAMFGEVRTALSDILFIKTERYLHSGIAYVPHMEEEILSISGAMKHADEHQAEVHGSAAHEDHDDHEDIASLIRGADNDFRHWIGHLERAVKPYNPPGKPHTHTDGRELLPWFRTMTISDPHYVTGYATGAWWLQARDPDQALAYIDEGIRGNPEAFQMYMTKGEILLRMARALDSDLRDMEAEPRRLVEEASAAFRQGAEIVSRQWGDADNWTSYKLEDALALARLDVMTERQYGDPAAAAARARRFLDTFGEDRALRRLAGGDGEGRKH